jgi:simple sugar transport system substrate-binding protein
MERPTRKARRCTVIVAACATAVLLATGCTGGSGAKEAVETQGASPGHKAGTPKITVAMVTHGAPGDTFWDLVRKGAEAAAAKDGVDLTYSSDPRGAGQAALVRKAVGREVDGIAVTLAKPGAMSPAVAKAKAAGIPVVGLNSGIDAWQSQGLLEYFGQDESVTGRAVGERLNSLGARHAVCVIHEQGNISLEARCASMKKSFAGKAENFYVNGTNMPSVKATIAARLRHDASIDEVITLGAPFALAAVQSVADAGSKAKVATFDLNQALVKAVRKGSVQFAVDQQPYLQGYLSVDALWLYKVNGNYSGGGAAPILTGPAFVSKGNVGAIAKFAAQGTR